MPSITIKLTRHGESLSNTGEVDHREVGDHRIALTDRGIEQARSAGRLISPAFFKNCLIYRSPYLRTRQTLDHLLESAGVSGARIYEDPRLREIDHGYEDVDEQQENREIHGWFYYRYRGGESPVDGFDRISTFLETCMRQAKRKGAENALICSHGISIRCFVVRFLHLGPEDYELMHNPRNCDVITISKDPARHETPVNFTCGKWGVSGLRIRGQ